MDERKTRLRDTALRGVDARQVLENPAYQAAMKAMKDQITKEWAECPVRDVEGQKLLLQLHKLAVKFENMLSGMVETGKLAQMNLDAERDESLARKVLRRVT